MNLLNKIANMFTGGLTNSCSDVDFHWDSDSRSERHNRRDQWFNLTFGKKMLLEAIYFEYHNNNQ